MAGYISPQDLDVIAAKGKPFTAALAVSLINNVVEIVNGEAGAKRVSSGALNINTASIYIHQPYSGANVTTDHVVKYNRAMFFYKMEPDHRNFLRLPENYEHNGPDYVPAEIRRVSNFNNTGTLDTLHITWDYIT